MVTGATGFLGSHLLCHLARCGETIIALKRDKSHVEETEALFSYYSDSPEEAVSPFIIVQPWFLSMAETGIRYWKRISRERKISVRFVWNVGYAYVL